MTSYLYEKPIGNLEIINVIVHFDMPVFSIVENENKEKFVYYLYSEYEELGYEEVLFSMLSESNYTKYCNGELSTLELFTKGKKIYFLKDNFDDLYDLKEININSLDFNKLPSPNYYAK